MRLKATLFLAALSGGFGQQASADLCEFTGNYDQRFIANIVIGARIVPLEIAFEDYQFMVFDACEAMGLPYDEVCTTYPLMGDIGMNALATTCSGVPKIVYDRRLSSHVGYAGAQAILAHELGHIWCGHLDDTVNASNAHQFELEADRFAGGLMRLLGFDQNQALSFVPILSEQSNHSHPARSDRIEALLAGWQEPDFVQSCIGRVR